MKASYNWLKDFVDFQLPPDELGHALTMAGFEVEAIEEVDNDTVFEIGVTPNRPDCLSIRGIAREISAILDIPFMETTANVSNEEGEGPSVMIECPELCPRYSSRVIHGVKTGPSPEWISKRLESCGIRPTSNIVDITNYILLEIGQPMHAFDLDKLAGKKIIVKQAGDTNKFRTLDDVERKIESESLLIWDAEKPVAIAGVMGGQNTEVSELTTNILLESAYFNPSSIRRTSKKLNLSSESSFRFERGVDKEAVTFALDRAAQLIVEIAGGRSTSITDEYPVPFESRKISVSIEKIASVIGIDLEEKFFDKTLRSLGFEIDPAGEKAASENHIVVPPSYRDDVEMDVDIAEEVARLYGYDNIPSTMPVMHLSPAPVHKTQELAKDLKNSMVKSGFSEVINFSFLNPDTLDKINLPKDDRRRNSVPVMNPLRMEDSVMRTTLVPALINNVCLNLKRGEKMLRFFEISKVFFQTDNKLPDEVIQLCAVYHKEAATALWENKHNGFYDLKGVFENIFQDLDISNVSFSVVPDRQEPYLHPGKSCSIMVGDNVIGVIGVLHPGVAGVFDLAGDITIAEIYNIEKILETIPSEKSFISLPKFPYVERDSALIVDDDIMVSDVRREIHNVKSDIIESITLFDIYKGKPIPDSKKSLAFSVRYRSVEKTLTDKEVDEIHSKIIMRLQDTIKAELRS